MNTTKYLLLLIRYGDNMRRIDSKYKNEKIDVKFRRFIVVDVKSGLETTLTTNVSSIKVGDLVIDGKYKVISQIFVEENNK